MNKTFRRILSLLLAMAMVILPLPVHATEEGSSAALTSENLRAKPGESVTLTLSLANCPAANNIALDFGTDLILDAEASSWLLADGVLTDFDSEGNQAVWTTDAEDGADVNGDVATLVFTLPFPCEEDVPLTCTVTLFDATSAVLAEVVAEATVDAAHAPAASVTVSETSLALDLAGTTTADLTASLVPEDATDTLSWKSSNDAVATVDENGHVTAVGVGEAEIVAYTNPSYIHDESVHEGKCAVTVSCSHILEHNHCDLCGYSEATNDSVARVAAPDGGYYYFTTLKEAIDFVCDLGLSFFESPKVTLLDDYTLTETITVDGFIKLFPYDYSEESITPNTITCTADVAFQVEEDSFLLMDYININTTGSRVVELVGNNSGVQFGPSTVSGATDTIAYVAEGVQNAGIQIYDATISGHTAITMNGSNGSFTVAGQTTSLNVTNPNGAIILNGTNNSGDIYSAINNENGVAFTLGSTSMLNAYGVVFNGENKYYNPHYNGWDPNLEENTGLILPNNGAAFRVECTYYGNGFHAFQVASEKIFKDENGNVIADASVPVTIIGNMATGENVTLGNANYPIELYATGNAPQILLEDGAVLNVTSEVRLHNMELYAQSGATVNGVAYLNAEDNSSIILESELDADEKYVAKVPYYDGTSLYFESLNDAIDTVMAVPVDARPPVLILRNCLLEESVTLDSSLSIFPAADASDSSFVAPMIFANGGIDAMFHIGGDCFFLSNYVSFNAQNSADYIFNITSSDASLLLSGCRAISAAKAAIHTTEDVHFESQQITNGDGQIIESNNIEIYGGEIQGAAAIILDGSGSHVTLAGMNPMLIGTGNDGAIVFNGDDHLVWGYMTNLISNNIAFTMNGNSTYLGGTYNGMSYVPGAENPSMPCAGVAGQFELGYYGDLQDAFDAIASVTYEVDALQIQILSDVTVTGDLVLEDVLYPVHLIMNGHTITLESGATLDIQDDLVALVNGTIYVKNGATFTGYADTSNNSQIVYEPAVSIGDQEYTSLAAAMADAQSGDVVKLLADTEAKELTIASGVTLDLSGYTVSAEYVNAVKGSQICDSSEGNTGLLQVSGGAILSADNEQLPVKTEEGYIFTDITNFQDMNREKDGKPQYLFLPSFEAFAHNALAAGYESSGAKIVLKLNWTSEAGSGSLPFYYGNELVAEVMNSYANGRYGKIFSAIINNVDGVDFTISIVLISDTGVEIPLA